MPIQGPIEKIERSEAKLAKKEEDLLVKLRPIQEELRSTRLKLEQLQSTKENNEKNKYFLYSSTIDIVQELWVLKQIL